jgi:hypothetical protein
MVGQWCCGVCGRGCVKAAVTAGNCLGKGEQGGQSRLFKHLRILSPFPLSLHSDGGFTATAIIATALKPFHLPPTLPAFIPYNGPGEPKAARRPVRKRRLVRKSPSPVSDEWPDIDEILKAIPGSDAASEDRGRATPTVKMAKSLDLLDCGILSTGRPMQDFLAWPMYKR